MIEPRALVGRRARPKSGGEVRHPRVSCHECNLLLVQSSLALYHAHGGMPFLIPCRPCQPRDSRFISVPLEIYIGELRSVLGTRRLYRAIVICIGHPRDLYRALRSISGKQVETKQGGKFGFFGGWEGPGAYVAGIVLLWLASCLLLGVRYRSPCPI